MENGGCGVFERIAILFDIDTDATAALQGYTAPVRPGKNRYVE